jgi:hypothetical protein
MQQYPKKEWIMDETEIYSYEELLDKVEDLESKLNEIYKLGYEVLNDPGSPNSNRQKIKQILKIASEYVEST